MLAYARSRSLTNRSDDGCFCRNRPFGDCCGVQQLRALIYAAQRQPLLSKQLSGTPQKPAINRNDRGL